MELIRKIMPLWLKILICRVIYFFVYFFPNAFKLIKNKKEKKIVLLEVPTYSNLGDQAIAYAEVCFFKDKFPDYNIVEISGIYYRLYKTVLKFVLTKNDLIVLIGGGNFGDEYLPIEKRRVDAIKYFKKFNMVIFPQTIFYSDTKIGEKSLKKMKAALSKNNDIIIFTREKKSFEFAKKNFNSKVELYPDIVLYLEKNFKKNTMRNSKCLLCLRNDVEKKTLNVDYIINRIDGLFNEIVVTDTIANDSHSFSNRDELLKNKWSEFSSSSVVVTDRLHGMIFSAITKTPCVALANYNHKIKSFYDTWFKDYDLIGFAENELEVIAQLERINTRNKKYDSLNFDKLFDTINDKIHTIIQDK